jgi:hypothetical protein
VRLLTKTEPAHVALRDAFAGKSDVINNQLGFVGNSVSLRGYKDAAEFVAVYPFAPYQFTLLQKIFESIRKVGATGKHLSRGERSLLDAFQSAAVRNADHGTDVLVPLYDFYPSIESFIDGLAKKSIDQAPENPSLQPFDCLLLKAMFLIRYIPDIVKPNIDNLATLCSTRSTPTSWPSSARSRRAWPGWSSNAWSAAMATCGFPDQRRARCGPRNRPCRSCCLRKVPPAGRTGV